MRKSHLRGGTGLRSLVFGRLRQLNATRFLHLHELAPMASFPVESASSTLALITQYLRAVRSVTTSVWGFDSVITQWELSCSVGSPNRGRWGDSSVAGPLVGLSLVVCAGRTTCV